MPPSNSRSQSYGQPHTSSSSSSSSQSRAQGRSSNHNSSHEVSHNNSASSSSNRSSSSSHYRSTGGQNAVESNNTRNKSGSSSSSTNNNNNNNNSSQHHTNNPTSSSTGSASSRANSNNNNNSNNHSNSYSNTGNVMPTHKHNNSSSSTIADDHSLMIHSNQSLRSITSLIDVHLTAKPHAFAGAVLAPKHARELTPKLVLAISHELGVKALENVSSNNNNNNNNNKFPSLSSHSTDSSKDGGAGGAGGGGDNFMNGESSSDNEAKVQYTLWITVAWSVLGWAEPSAALFWEMATMFHTLYVAGRSIEVEETTEISNVHDIPGGIHRSYSQSIPPILSCGSSQSMDSGGDYNTNNKSKRNDDDKYKKYQGSPGSITYTGSDKGGISSVTSSPNTLSKKGMSGTNTTTTTTDKQKSAHNNNKASAASAKELPVWLVGMFLLLHCEDQAFLRNVSAEDDRRFDALNIGKSSSATGAVGDIWKDGLVGKSVDFGMLLAHPSLSLRSQLHIGHYIMNNSNCTGYVLRHLRKFLLLCATPHNPDALMAIMTLVDSPSDFDAEYADRMNGSLPYTRDADPEILQHRHDTEHGDIGLNVTLTADDIERLNLILQGPSGGMIHDPPLMISELMPLEDLAVYDKISLDEVEKEIRRHLELDLITIMDENAQMDDSVHIDTVTKDMGKLNFNENMEEEELSRDRKEKLKELKYSKIRGTTTILKPVSQQQTSSDLSQSPAFSSSGRLHDVHVSECSDAHMYLLQPFEHVTISACTGCTIVVGAVAGLLHVVNCEKTDIIVAARRVLLSNCVDVSHYLFTPSPPLLVGNNRCCQFAPYNTYYDGLREDLLATGLAAAILSPDNMGMGDNVNGPSLQCASNKWKHSLELTKQSDLLPIHIPPRSSSPLPGSASGTDDKALSEESMQTPTLVPASEFQLLFVPLQTEASRKRRVQYESEEKNNGIGSLYCHNLAEVLQLSPFRLPTEYERRAMIKADRIKMLQQAIKNELLPEQQVKLEEELNRRFRDWLVASGNLRQVIDLVHLDNKGVR